MDLQPLFNASFAIKLHLALALVAIFLGGYQLASIKGTPRHKSTGKMWALLVALVAITGFFIHELQVWGKWSPIHLLSVLVLVLLPIGVMAARSGNITRHRKMMIFLYFAALIGAGLVNFYPGRLLHAMFF